MLHGHNVIGFEESAKGIKTSISNSSKELEDDLKRSITNEIFYELNLKKTIAVNYILKPNKILNSPKFKKIKSEYIKEKILSAAHIDIFKDLIISNLSRGKLKNYKINRFINDYEEVKSTLEFLISFDKFQNDYKLLFFC